MNLSCNATTPQELRDEIVSLLMHRAAQQDGLASTTQSTLQIRIFLHTSQVLSNIAKEIRDMEIITDWPAGLREGK